MRWTQVIRLIEGRIILGVVGNISPHPPGLEVIVRPEKQRFSPDPVHVGGRDRSRVRLHNLVQQAQRRVAADHPFIHGPPLIV